MNCEETREQLERRFDDGAELSTESEAHLAQCHTCRFFRNELAAVGDALGHLPIEAATPGLAARVKTHVAVHGQVHEAQMPASARWASAAGVVLTVCVAGWFIPISVELRAWSSTLIADALEQPPLLPVGIAAWHDAAIAYVPEMDWRQAASSVSSQLDALSGSVTPWIGEVTGRFPSGVLWLSVVFGAMLLIGCNGFEALRLRTTRVNGSERGA